MNRTARPSAVPKVPRAVRVPIHFWGDSDPNHELINEAVQAENIAPQHGHRQAPADQRGQVNDRPVEYAPDVPVQRATASATSSFSGTEAITYRNVTFSELKKSRS